MVISFLQRTNPPVIPCLQADIPPVDSRQGMYIKTQPEIKVPCAGVSKNDVDVRYFQDVTQLVGYGVRYYSSLLVSLIPTLDIRHI